MAGAGEQSRPTFDEYRPMTDISTPVKRAHEVLRHVAMCSSTRMVEREVLKEVVLDTRRRFVGCLMLPVTLLFFTFFAISSIIHEDVAYKHVTEFPVRSVLNPMLEEGEDADNSMLDGLSTVEDVWVYLENTFVPFFFRNQDFSAADLPADARNSKVLEYNEVLGGIKMTLFRGPRQPCGDPLMNYLTCFPQGPGNVISTQQYGGNISELYKPDKNASYWWSGHDSILKCQDEGFINCGEQTHDVQYCFGGGCWVNDTIPGGERPLPIDMWDFDRRLTPLREELASKMPVAQSAVAKLVEGPKNFEFRLQANDTIDKTMARLMYLKERGWIDEQTLQMKIDVTLYNYQIKVPRLCNVQFNFLFSRGGGVFTTQSFEVSALKTFNDKIVIVFDLLFALTVALSTFYIALEFLKDMKTGRLLGHFTLANVVTWLSCAIGFLHLCGLAARFFMQKTVMAALDGYITYQDDYAADVVTKAAANVNFTSYVFRVFQTVAYIVFMFRCFLSLRFQPRMAIITTTLAGTTCDLFHFFLVLLPTWFGFAASAQLMFGRRVQYFSTLTSGFCFCLQIMLEGEFDWPLISAEDFWFAIAWAWIYMLLMVLIMLNLCLAIIMEVYAQVNRHQGETMTLWGHIGYLVNRAIYFKHWVPDMEIWERVSEMPQCIVVDELREAFPLMPAPQVNFLVNASRNAVRVIQREGIDVTYTVQMLAAIHISLEEVANDLVKLKRRGWMGKGLEVSNDKDRDFVKEILSGISMQTHWMHLTQEHLSKIYQKVGITEMPTSDWKLIKKAEVAPPPVHQGND
eukprot:TRINITY_DN26184_c0_g1_i1.p1 TRINITY_DN26184_c0_g1~~TRINITY_DN26184_c0_g1_i1.p1  ORF type:complete len:800 (-),score=119.58 TRINITY_DN26184_c0_g1_i1:99-2498(-)